MKNDKATLNQIEAVIEQFNTVYGPAKAAETARTAIDNNFIVIDPKKLPAVGIDLAGRAVCIDTIVPKDTSVAYAVMRAREWMAIARKLEHLEREKANREIFLNKKRDKVYRRLFPYADAALDYSTALTAVKTAIDEIVRLEEEIDSKKNRL